MMKRTISAFAVIFVILSVFTWAEPDYEIPPAIKTAVMAVPEPESVPNEPEIVPEGEISLVVLGDSIARGYGLQNVESERFSAVLEASLSQKYAEVTVSNYGVDGITGAQLSETLKTAPPDDLANADYALISIGGNNVLGRLASLDGLEQLSDDINKKVFFDYFRFLLSDTEEEKKALDYARESLNLLFKTANDTLGGAQFKSLVNTAAENLKTEIPEIIKHIRQINPDCKIIIQTVYNPYKGINIALKALDHTLDLASFGEMAVLPLNQAIEGLASEYGYTVAPVWGGFEASSKQLTNAGFDILNALFGVDPHPNSAGHALIAEIYFKLITEE